MKIKKQDIELQEEQLSRLKQGFAEQECPFIPGDVIQDLRSDKVKISEIYYSKSSVGYYLKGYYYLKSGKLSEKERYIGVFPWSEWVRVGLSSE